MKSSLASSLASRWTQVLLLLGVAVALLLLLVFFLLFLPQNQPVSAPTSNLSPSAGVEGVAALPSTPLPAAPSTSAAPAGIPAAPSDGARPVEASAAPSPDAPVVQEALGEDVVAVVNGQVLRRDQLQVMVQVDGVMAALLGTPAETVQNRWLDRLIHGELVAQAAAAVGFRLPADDAEARLTSLLAQRGLDPQALSDALADVGVTWDAFLAYFQRLLLTDAFAREEAAALGIPVGDYLANLRQQARVSYGPIATALLNGQMDLAPTSAPGDEMDPAEATADDVPVDQATAATPATPEAATDVNTLADAPSPSSDAPAESAGEALVKEPRGTAVGQYAPSFSLPLLGAEADTLLSLDDNFSGQPLLLSFWTTWCPYCRRQTPVLVEAYGRYAAAGIQFVGINVGEDPALVARYVEEANMPYPVLLDRQQQVAHAYGVRGFPTAYFLDTQGRIVARHIGVLSPELLERYLQPLLPTE